MKALIVDDSEIVRNQIVRALSDCGVECSEAVDGEDGYEKLASSEGCYGVVFLDLNMPNLSGMAMLEKYKNSSALYGKSHYFIVSTETSALLKEKAKELGVKAWVVKPVNEVVIQKIADRFLK